MVFLRRRPSRYTWELTVVWGLTRVWIVVRGLSLRVTSLNTVLFIPKRNLFHVLIVISRIRIEVVSTNTVVSNIYHNFGLDWLSCNISFFCLRFVWIANPQPLSPSRFPSCHVKRVLCVTSPSNDILYYYNTIVFIWNCFWIQKTCGFVKWGEWKIKWERGKGSGMEEERENKQVENKSVTKVTGLRSIVPN